MKVRDLSLLAVALALSGAAVAAPYTNVLRRRPSECVRLAYVPACLCASVVHVSDVWPQQPLPHLGSGHADIVPTSHLQHAVEGVDSYVNFSRPTFVYAVNGVRRRSFVSIAR